MDDYLFEFILIIGLGYFVYFFTRAFKFSHEEHQFSDVRRSARDALIALFIGWVAISALFLLFSILGISGGKRQDFSWWNVIRQILLYCLFFAPVLIVIRRRHETLSSAGITKRNLGKSAVLGAILSHFPISINTIMKRF